MSPDHEQALVIDASFVAKSGKKTYGYNSKQKFTGGIRGLGLHQIGKLRIDANLRSLYQGHQRPGPGCPQTYDGKVNWDALTRFDKVETEDDQIVIYHQVLNHVQFQ